MLCFHALLLLLLRVEKYELSFCLSSYLSFEYNNIRNSKTLIIILFIIYPFAVRFWGCMYIKLHSFISLFSVKGNTSSLDAEYDVYHQSVEIATKKYITGVTVFFFFWESRGKSFYQ